MNIKDRALRAVALTLSAALIQASFGSPAWAAVQAVSEMSAPVGSGSAAGSVTSALSGAAAPTFGAFAANLAVSPAVLAAPALPTAALSAASASAPAAAPAAFSAAAADAAPAAPEASAPTAAAVAAPALALTPISAPAPDESVSSPIRIEQAGPRSASISGRLSRRFAELRAYFSGRGDAALAAAPAGSDAAFAGTGSAANSVRSGLSAATTLSAAADEAKTDADVPAPAQSPAATPAPAAAPRASAAARRSINWFLGGMLVAQVGVEVLGLAMPLLMRQKFGGFEALAHIAVVSSAASIVGRLTGGWIANKVGIKPTYITATALRLVSITAMVVFLLGPTGPIVAAVPPLAAFATLLSHYSALGVLTGFYSINALMQGVAVTAQNSIPTALLGSDRATLERFFSLQQWLMEIIGVSGPKMGGVLVQTFGFTAAIMVYPVVLTAAVIMYAFGLRMPKEGDSQEEAAPAQARPSRIRALSAPIGRFVGRILGGITSAVDFLVLKAYLGRWIAKLGGQGNLNDTDEHNLLTRSTLGWTTAALFSLAGFATMLLPLSLPAYGAMILFGVSEVIASQKLYSLILSRTKSKAESVKVNAVAGATFAAFYTVALNLAGMVFDHFTGRAPFLIFNAAMIPVAVAVFLISRRLKKHAAAGAPELADANRPKNGFKLLFKDPMMRWAFAAYVLLSMTNPLLYQILSQAFGLLIVGGTAAAASGVASSITSLYSLGGLLGALYMWRESTLISNAKKTEAPAHK